MMNEGHMTTEERTWEELVAAAKSALAAGYTRGRFIRENSTDSTPKLYLQLLSDAYSEAAKPCGF